MNRLLLSTCLLAFSARVFAGGAGSPATTNLTLVKQTKYNVIGAVFAGRQCSGLNPKTIKATLEQVDVKVAARDTTLDTYVEGLRKAAVDPLSKLAKTAGQCVFQDLVVMGSFPNAKKEIEEVTSLTIKGLQTPTTIVAYKKVTPWNPDISTKSLVGYNSNPTYFNVSTYNKDKYDADTYVVLSTDKSGGLLGGKDGGLKIELSDEKKADAIIKSMPSVGKVKFASVPERLLKSGLIAPDYAAGITVKAVGMTIFGALAVMYLPVVPELRGDVRHMAEGLFKETPNNLSGMITICSEGSDSRESGATCRYIKSKVVQATVRQPAGL